jgi:Domain of unknown function (DUF4412)
MAAERKKRRGTSGMVLAALVLFSSCFAPFAEAGWRITAMTASLSAPTSSGNPSQIVTYASQNKIKYETRVWAQVIDLRTQQLLVLNHLGRMYWEGSIDDYLAAMTKRTLEVRAQMDKLRQRLSAEQRLILERNGGPFDTGAPTLEITVRQSSEQETVIGYKARKYVVLRNGEPYEETWIAEGIDFGAELDMQKLRGFIGKLQASRTSPPGTVLAELTRLIDKGYPVKTVNLLSNRIKEVILVERKSIPAEEFAVPPGYSQKTLADIMSPRTTTPRSSSGVFQ